MQQPGNSGSPSGIIAGERKKRVLIVDDNVDAGETLRDLLSIWGYETIFSPRAVLALAKLAEFKPDYCLCDIAMPEMDGYQFARAVRSRTEFKPIFLIALTSYSWPEHREAALDAGFDEHISKTVELEFLKTVLGASKVHLTEP